MAKIEEFGRVEGGYFYGGSATGIKVERLKPYRGVVKNVVKMWPWYEVTVETETGEKLTYSIHNNWIIKNGEIRVGDELEGVVDVVENTSHYTRRVRKEGEVSL
jgi:hypothetical protein